MRINLLRISGFTLIEIIVVVGVISILVSVSFSGYAVFTQRQKLMSDGQTFKNTLRDVQSRSYNGEVDCNVCSCSAANSKSLDGWFVNLVSRQFYGQCGGVNFSLTGLKLSDDAVIDTNNNIIQFVNDPPRVNIETNICLSLSSLSGKYYRIEVSTSGDISDTGGLIAACAP